MCITMRCESAKTGLIPENVMSMPALFNPNTSSGQTGYILIITNKKTLTEVKKTSPQIKAVYSQTLQDVIGRVDSAFAFMKQRGYGFPRFKKFGQFKSLLFPQMSNDAIKGNQIKLPKIGLVTINLHRPIPEGFRLKTAIIVRKASGWYVMLALQIDVLFPDVPPHGQAIGIDVGLEYFLSTSDGEQVKRPRFFNDLHRKLELLQRRLRNKKKGSAIRRRLNQKIAIVHEKIANCRRDFHLKLAHKLCDRSGMIFVEDLDFRVMAKGMLGKHTLDAALGQFVNQVLPWVCWKRDVYYGKVNASGTSQECPDCGAYVKKDLSVRLHECHECGSVKPRDIASGQVIVKRGLSAVGQTVEQIACGGEGTGAAMPSYHPKTQELLKVISGSQLCT